MPRANRVRLPGYIWHITHRCHKREFLLKFARDRRRWRYWLYQARSRYGLCVFNYVATSNHIHLLVKDQGKGEIASSMQLIAGRTAQEYNQRKQRRGAYWEDRYHATAIENGRYLAQCMVYIDLNMVRAGAVAHPGGWDVCGYSELQNPPERYRIIDQDALAESLEIGERSSLSAQVREWTNATLAVEHSVRQDHWSSSLAVGSQGFVEQFKSAGGVSQQYRRVAQNSAAFILNEPSAAYTWD